jgi:hypothetical protein
MGFNSVFKGLNWFLASKELRPSWLSAYMKTNESTDLHARLISCAMFNKEYRHHYIKATATEKHPTINIF